MTDWRQEWDLPEGRIYLDSAYQGPFPQVAAQAAGEAIDLKRFPERLTPEYYLELPQQVRTLFAKLIGASPEEIALTNGASDGINYVANGLDWKPGDEIVLPAAEFPANFFSWVNLKKQGVKVIEVEPSDGRFVSAGDLLAALTGKTRLVAASYVGYTTSNRIDLGPVGAECRRRGIPLVVDASQAAGALAFTVDDLQCDYMAVAGYKWLWSPYGTGFFYARREAQDRLKVNDIRWLNVKDADKFNQLPHGDWQLQSDARRWDVVEVSNFINLAASRASLTLLSKIGPANIEQHTRPLLQQIVDRLPRDRMVLCSPEDPDRRGPFVNIAARTPEQTEKLWEELRSRNMHVSLRADTLRISVSIFNRGWEIDKLLAVLAE